MEKLSDDEGFSSDSDDDAIPEAAGQIKVAMFRVLASGKSREESTRLNSMLMTMMKEG